ncbi:hypothetical protein NPIL_472251 [Nephila pilipes]|uniref:Uncharacterized protein n=1 Tax=Nephila pilipes TaxID=299642 RepID=A0A8X6MST8_NEPPI|nr:hypothetical protein NPIL_472251 [Nephila pilipes]
MRLVTCFPRRMLLPSLLFGPHGCRSLTGGRSVACFGWKGSGTSAVSAVECSWCWKHVFREQLFCTHLALEPDRKVIRVAPLKNHYFLNCHVQQRDYSARGPLFPFLEFLISEMHFRSLVIDGGKRIGFLWEVSVEIRLLLMRSFFDGCPCAGIWDLPIASGWFAAKARPQWLISGYFL